MNCDFSVPSVVEAPVARKTILTPTRLNNAARTLEEMGWRKDVAGADFSVGVDAFLECVFSSPPKGLLISGASGVGKTAFAKAVLGAFLAHTVRKPLTLNLSDPETLALIDYEREPDIVEEFCSRSLILDDLGAERAQSNFGQPREIAAEFIMRYHEKCSGHRLFVTTNLTGEELLARYQQRVLTRLTDMMHFVKFTGTSKRGNGGAA
jgi:DNA replication protein DnaC